MQKQILAGALFAFVLQISNAQTKMDFKYPTTKKVDHADEYFGTKIQDPYRWLEEDDRAEDTKDWVKREVAFSNNCRVSQRC